MHLRWQPILLTVFALNAFAANSILCRMALGTGRIDPAGFTVIRLFSGAVVLWVIAKAAGRPAAAERRGSWVSAAALFLYAVAFSFAYVSLDAGMGALILFGAVQTTMIGVGLMRGERPRVATWCGLFIAVAGLVYLVMPGQKAPSFFGAGLMAVAGCSWGFYSLRGLNVANPVAVTADNFLRSVPLAFAVSLPFIAGLQLSPAGAGLAAISGGLTSGIGYVAWYAALRHLSATRAAVLQLLVPVIAALGGVLLLSEQVSLRLALSGLLIVGGVGLTLTAGKR